MRKLHGKVIVITGASSGLGAAIACLASERGAVPVLLARRTDKLAEVAERIHGESLTLTVDVTDELQVEDAVAQIINKYGRIDIWINNAGYGLFEYCIDTPMAGFEQLMEVNYFSVVRCTKAVLPHMLKEKKGHIVNVASIAGKIGTPKAAAYSASKHAVLGFTNSLRAELASEGIKVSAINPGPIDTPFFDIADPGGYYKKNIEWFMLKPEKVARAILDVMITGKAEISLPLTASWGARMLQLFPNWLSGVSARLLNKK